MPLLTAASIGTLCSRWPGISRRLIMCGEINDSLWPQRKVAEIKRTSPGVAGTVIVVSQTASWRAIAFAAECSGRPPVGALSQSLAALVSQESSGVLNASGSAALKQQRRHQDFSGEGTRDCRSNFNLHEIAVTPPDKFLIQHVRCLWEERLTLLDL